MKRAAAVVVLLLITAPLAYAALNNPSTNPLRGAERVNATLTGTITSRLPAGSYTYLEVDHTWVVTLGEAPAPGTRVTVQAYARAHHFESRRLHRTFDTLLFGAVHPQSQEQ